MSQVLTGQQNPGVDFCRGAAEALNERPEKVLRLAGLLPQRSERDEVADEIMFCYERMKPQSRDHFRIIARSFAEGRLRGADE